MALAENGPSSCDYTKIVSSLVAELRLFYEIEEMINPTSGTIDVL